MYLSVCRVARDGRETGLEDFSVSYLFVIELFACVQHNFYVTPNNYIVKEISSE